MVEQCGKTEGTRCVCVGGGASVIRSVYPSLGNVLGFLEGIGVYSYGF